MNFLAHLYLSGDDDEIMLGNILGDFLKKHNTTHFPEKIQKGIVLHHLIDHYTDNHPIVEKTKIRLRPQFAHYSPVIADMFFDHFLAANWEQYSDINLYQYSHYCYKLFYTNRVYFPSRAKRLFIYMRLENIFIAYGSINGIKKVLKRMAYRTKYKSNLELATQELIDNYDLYKEEFRQFFGDIIEYAANERKRLLE